jgi:nucleotide-binding universal stress UspA family protein
MVRGRSAREESDGAERVRIERLLCPTDFSDFSERAPRRALNLARWFEARVIALHVVQPS